MKITDSTVLYFQEMEDDEIKYMYLLSGYVIIHVHYVAPLDNKNNNQIMIALIIAMMNMMSVLHS